MQFFLLHLPIRTVERPDRQPHLCFDSDLNELPGRNGGLCLGFLSIPVQTACLSRAEQPVTAEGKEGGGVDIGGGEGCSVLFKLYQFVEVCVHDPGMIRKVFDIAVGVNVLFL